MLSRFSVKHPYIVVVAVIICLLLGGVSLQSMKTDLLPNMDIPYLAVIATDPGPRPRRWRRRSPSRSRARSPRCPAWTAS
ncbi:hypothetical protein [uncultured Adlercreutzia sp.]|uniref:hypothetical protein n=1 Tax=uncultured Adlercreutzia sp. TaxID=875803 RepID=UPI002588AF2C|nr:hypothetical protein [uncultured Adlercreutzia sp.]